MSSVDKFNLADPDFRGLLDLIAAVLVEEDFASKFMLSEKQANKDVRTGGGQDNKIDKAHG